MKNAVHLYPSHISQRHQPGFSLTIINHFILKKFYSFSLKQCSAICALSSFGFCDFINAYIDGFVSAIEPPAYIRINIYIQQKKLITKVFSANPKSNITIFFSNNSELYISF